MTPDQLFDVWIAIAGLIAGVVFVVFILPMFLDLD